MRESPIYRLHGRLLDVSLIWGLERTPDGDIYVNGTPMVSCTSYEDYMKLEKKFFSYRGWNYDR
jgi:hypothetical protein